MNRCRWCLMELPEGKEYACADCEAFSAKTGLSIEELRRSGYVPPQFVDALYRLAAGAEVEADR